MTGPSPAALPDMMEKAVARMDRIYTDALTAGVLKTDTYLVLEKPVEREDLPEEIATDEDILPSEIDASVPAAPAAGVQSFTVQRSEEHTPELQSLMRISYAVFC